MKIGLILCLALMMALAMAAQAYVRGVPNNKLATDGSTAPVAKTSPASKDAADLVISDNVHVNSCYISTVRCIDFDPYFGTKGAAFMAYRTKDGLGLNYLGSIDGGASYTLTPGLNTFTTIRYPSVMADLANQVPWIVYNTGIFVTPTKGAYYAYDLGGYNAGMWSTEARVDSLGAGSAVNGMYIGCGYKGTNGVVNWLHGYWGVNTPDAAFYYRSTDFTVDEGGTWDTVSPRSGNLLMYDLDGTSDSNNIFGIGNPVVHDSLIGGWMNSLELFGSVTGETLIIGTCGIIDTLDFETDRGAMRFWYRMSYDGGLNWTPLTWAPYAGWLNWTLGSYDMGVAIDKDGYPHFASFLMMDTTTTVDLAGPNSGIYDYHLTAGGWVLTKIHGGDTVHTSPSKFIYQQPRFCNYGRDVNGNLFVSFATDVEGATKKMNVWIAKTKDNGAHYGQKQVTIDGAGYDYPHIPMNIGGTGSKIPVFYQVASDGYISWVNYDDVPDGIEGESPVQVTHNFALNQSAPNPARSITSISFNLPKSGNYSLKIYNIAGQVIRTLDSKGVAGQNTVTWNGLDNSGRKVANGVYLYNLNAFGNSATKKLVVVR